MSPFENADYTEEVSITSLGGLDFTNMANNEIIRKTSDTTAEGSGTTIQDEVAGEFYIKKIFNFINVPPFNILLGGILNSYNILTSSYKTQIAPKSSSIGSSQGLFLTSTVLDGNIKVGINISEPEEELEVDGNIQIDSGNVARLKFQKSGQSAHALGEIDGEQDGGNGGDLQFFTKVDGGSVTEKLRINNKGAIGVGGELFGNDGQFLMSKGNAAVPVWSPIADDTDAISFYLNTTQNNLTDSTTYDIMAYGFYTRGSVPGISFNTTTNRFDITNAGTYIVSAVAFLKGQGGAIYHTNQSFIQIYNNASPPAIVSGFEGGLSVGSSDPDITGQGAIIPSFVYVFNANDSVRFSARAVGANFRLLANLCYITFLRIK